MALSFLSKKAFDPKKPQNVQRVYDAERKVIEENRKLVELQRAMETEREQEALEREHASNVGRPPKRERLDWMYEGVATSAPSADDYLLGRARVEDEPAPAPAADGAAADSAGPAEAAQGHAKPALLPARKQFTVRVEDPMFAVMASEGRRAAESMADPVAMARLRERLLNERLRARAKEQGQAHAAPGHVPAPPSSALPSSAQPSKPLGSRWGDARPARESTAPLASSHEGGDTEDQHQHRRRRKRHRDDDDDDDHAKGSHHRHHHRRRHRHAGDDDDDVHAEGSHHRRRHRRRHAGDDDDADHAEGSHHRHRRHRRSRSRRSADGRDDADEPPADAAGAGAATASLALPRGRAGGLPASGPDAPAAAAAPTAPAAAGAESQAFARSDAPEGRSAEGPAPALASTAEREPQVQLAERRARERRAGYGLRLPASKAAAPSGPAAAVGPSAAMVASRTSTLSKMREAGGRDGKTAELILGQRAAPAQRPEGAGGAATGAAVSSGAQAPGRVEARTLPRAMTEAERQEALARMAADGDRLARAQRERAMATRRGAAATDEAERLALERAGAAGGAALVARALAPNGSTDDPVTE